MRAFPRLLILVAVVFAITAAVTCLRPESALRSTTAQSYCYDVTLGFAPYTHARVCPPVAMTRAS